MNNDKLMISVNGDLISVYDFSLVRKNYSRHYNRINSIADLKATIRSGKYVFPGGYPIYFIADDGSSLSYDTVRDEFGNCCYSTSHQIKDGWMIVSCEINYDDFNLECIHSGKPIECAYDQDEDSE